MASNKRYGMRKEEEVANLLSRYGARVAMSPGSLGTGDLAALWPDRSYWLIQVKASRTGEPADLSPRQIRRLKMAAACLGAIPVLAKVAGGGVALLGCERVLAVVQIKAAPAFPG